jgi:low temperature requirement protein LtrA
MSSHLTYSDDVAIAKLAYYTPALFISLYVTYKHGFSRGSGWVFLAIFCIIRIVGSGAQLATINNDHPDTAYTIALITTVLGLSPLLLATLGIISRMQVNNLGGMGLSPC